MNKGCSGEGYVPLGLHYPTVLLLYCQVSCSDMKAWELAEIDLLTMMKQHLVSKIIRNKINSD